MFAEPVQRDHGKQVLTNIAFGCSTCQMEWQIDMLTRMSEDMPDRMPEHMPDRMSEDMTDRLPDRMSEDMTDRMS